MPKYQFRTARCAALAAVAAVTAACGREPAPSPAPVATPPATVPGRPAGDVPEDSRVPQDPAPAAPPRTAAAGAAGATAPATAAPTPTPAPTPEAPAATPAAAPPAVAPAAPPRPPLSPEVRAARDAARAKVAAEQASEAIADLKAAEAKLGESADLRIESGRAFLALAESSLARGEDSFLVKGLVADAHLRWKQATKLDAGVPGAAVLRARIYRFEENPAGAKDVLTAQVAAQPDDAEAHALIGEMATAARNWESADLHWTKAAVLDPTDGRARLQATLAKQWLKVPTAQLEAGYLAAARLLPADPDPVRLLASLHPKDREKRLALMQQVIDGSPKAIWARIWMAHIVRTEGTPDAKRAKEILTAALAVDPNHAAAHYNLGLVEQQSGDLVGAVKEYLACVENSPAGNCSQASDALDQLLHDPAMGAGKDVPLPLRTRCYDAVLAKNPAEGRYGNNAGLWWRDVGRDYEQSLRCYLASVAAAPDDQDYLNDCALIYLFHLTDRKELSFPMFEKVVALVEEDGQPPIRGYWDTLENLCKYWFEKGEYEKVVLCAKKRADPKAELNGAPYPSLRAAGYGVQAAKKMAEAKKGGK